MKTKSKQKMLIRVNQKFVYFGNILTFNKMFSYKLFLTTLICVISYSNYFGYVKQMSVKKLFYYTLFNICFL